MCVLPNTKLVRCLPTHVVLEPNAAEEVCVNSAPNLCKKILGLNCESNHHRSEITGGCNKIENLSSGRVTKKKSSTREKRQSESPHCNNRRHLPLHPPSPGWYPPLNHHCPLYPDIPKTPHPTTTPVPKSFTPFLPNNPPPRVPTGTHQNFQKEIMAELLRHALPEKMNKI